jgi:hypothetical protein
MRVAAANRADNAAGLAAAELSAEGTRLPMIKIAMAAVANLPVRPILKKLIMRFGRRR